MLFDVGVAFPLGAIVATVLLANNGKAVVVAMNLD